MGLHDQLISISGALHADRFGDDVDYYPPRGSSETGPIRLRHVTVSAEMSETDFSLEGKTVIRKRIFKVITNRRSSRYCGQQAILRGSTLVYEGTRYAVETEAVRAGVDTFAIEGRNVGVMQVSRESFRGPLRGS